MEEQDDENISHTDSESDNSSEDSSPSDNSDFITGMVVLYIASAITFVVGVLCIIWYLTEHSTNDWGMRVKNISLAAGWYLLAGKVTHSLWSD